MEANVEISNFIVWQTTTLHKRSVFPMLVHETIYMVNLREMKEKKG